MKIAIVQIEPIKGDIEKNLDKHLECINETLEIQPDLLMFPELSLSGYEPELAKCLAVDSNDKRMDELQKVSDKRHIILCVGVPTTKNNNLFVSMIIFQPNKERITYSKQYLYPTETKVFTAGDTPCFIPYEDDIIAPAICYELSNNEHIGNACKVGATIYMASVLNSISGVDADIEKLSQIASIYGMTTFMANYVGSSGGYECAGKSSIWNSNGELIAQLDNRIEGILMFDTKAEYIKKINLTNIWNAKS
jgi:predicted amidohydrolase